MQLLPIAGFYFKHGSQIESLMSKGGTGDGHLISDLAAALAPVIKNHWPSLDENGLIDDAVELLRQMFAPPPGA